MANGRKGVSFRYADGIHRHRPSAALALWFALALRWVLVGLWLWMVGDTYNITKQTDNIC
jgi:hypothetical protein